ncbi:MAG: c-type cytochrome [Campylobacteraceae bacterium]|nr:c-type cytochrome [Campylobacteraceae bacterium]
MRNRFLLIILCFVLAGCGGGSDKQNTSDDAKALLETFDNLNKSAQNVISSVANTTSEIIEKADEITKEAAQKADDITKDLSQKADETAKTLSENLEKVNQKANETVQSVGKIADKVIQKAENTVNAATSPLNDLENGKKVFRRCIPCHGPKANLSAVGKSQDISKWSKESIANAIKGYKDGTYGGSSKATMISSIKSLKPQDITDVASYIPTLRE